MKMFDDLWTTFLCCTTVVVALAMAACSTEGAVTGPPPDLGDDVLQRTEFDLAHKLRPRKVAHFASIEALRTDLIDSIAEYRRERHRGSIADFDPTGSSRSSNITPPTSSCSRKSTRAPHAPGKRTSPGNSPGFSIIPTTPWGTTSACAADATATRR